MKSFVIIGLLVLTGCSASKDPGCLNVDVAAALKTSGRLPLSEMVTGLEVIRLDTVRDAYFGDMNSLSMTDRYIGFVCDQQKRAYLFNRTGKFLGNIGRIGKGPGEYTEPCVLAISPDEKFIVVGDPWQGKLILYTIEGSFVREKVIKTDSPGWRFDKVRFADNNSIFVVFRRPLKPGQGYASILQYDLQFKLTAKILPRAATQDEVEVSYPYPTLLPTRDGTCFWEAGRDTIYYIDRKGVATPRYHLEIRNHCFDLEKGQRNLYQPGQMDRCTKALRIIDLPGYLMVTLFDQGSSRDLVIDKNTYTAYGADKPIACDTSSQLSWVNSSIENDLFGIEPLYLDQYDPVRNELICAVRPGWISDSHDMTCVRARKVKYPEARDQLADLAESRTGLENMAIVVMKMK